MKLQHGEVHQTDLRLVQCIGPQLFEPALVVLCVGIWSRLLRELRIDWRDLNRSGAGCVESRHQVIEGTVSARRDRYSADQRQQRRHQQAGWQAKSSDSYRGELPVEGIDGHRSEWDFIRPNQEAALGKGDTQISPTQALSKGPECRPLLFLGIRFVTEQEDDVGEGRKRRCGIGH